MTGAMTGLRRTAIWTACGALLLAGPAGCRDRDAERRAEIQRLLQEAQGQLGALSIDAVGSGDEESSSVEETLQGIARRLAGVNDGAPGQQAAAALLAATAQRELAALELERVSGLESRRRNDRRLVAGKLAALVDLEMVAVRQESVAVDVDETDLATHRVAADNALADASARIAELEDPISERVMANSSDVREVDRLRQEADALSREATELGHADGFDRFERAVALRRQADQIEFEISQREIDLSYDLQSEYDLAETRADHLTSLIESIDVSRQELETVASQATADAGVTRRRGDELRTQIAGLLAAMDETGGELAVRYESAAGLLEQAGANAQRAGRASGDLKASAGLLAARVHETVGRMQWQRARALGEQGRLHEAMALMGATAGDPAEEAGRRAEEAATARDEASSAALASFTAAAEALGTVSSRDLQPQLERMRMNLQQAQSMISGEPVPQLDAAPPATPGAEPAPAPSAAAGAFSSPEEVVAFLQGLDPADMRGARQVAELLHGETADGRALKQASFAVADGMGDLLDATAEAFGAQADPIRQQLTAQSGMNQITSADITDRSDDRATVRYTSPQLPQGATFDLVNVDGRWLIDAESFYAPAVAQTGGTMSMADIAKLMAAIGDACGDVADDVKAGRISSPVELQQTLGQKMMEAMGNAMPGGGMPGAGGPGQ
ncbi:MAG: coiled-coil domain-containing protein [Planctomycetota bacterium]|jgi:hypothetical protein